MGQQKEEMIKDVQKAEEIICRECEWKKGIFISEGKRKVRLHFYCKNPNMKVVRITEHGETWFATWREIKNTGIQQTWCPLKTINIVISLPLKIEKESNKEERLSGVIWVCDICGVQCDSDMMKKTHTKETLHDIYTPIPEDQTQKKT